MLAIAGPAQGATVTLWAHSASESPASATAWSNKSGVGGNPGCAAACSCSSSNAADNDRDFGDRKYLSIDDFDDFQLPALHRVESVQVVVSARYASGTLPGSSRIRMYVDSEPSVCSAYNDNVAPGCIKTAHESDRWTSDTSSCRWRTFDGQPALELVGLHPIANNVWDAAAINRLRIGLRAAGNGSDEFLVNAVGLVVRYEYACGNGVVDGSGEQCDLGSDNGAPGSCCTAQCAFVAPGTLCRPSLGTCDPADVCSGAAASCPDVRAPAGAICRAATSACDPAEVCDGSSPVCPADASGCPPICGNQSCDSGESCASCPRDCGSCAPSCGDGACTGGETCAGCAGDCGECPLCPNGECGEGESCSSCPEDCSVCCGDGVCGDAAESCDECVSDCGACPVGASNVPRPPTVDDLARDHRSDLLVWRASGAWWIHTAGGQRPPNVERIDKRYTYSADFGGPGDFPFVADYDGDRRGDLMVLRQNADTTFDVFARSSRFARTDQFRLSGLGLDGKWVAALDDDGDAVEDVAVFEAREVPQPPGRPRVAGAWIVRISKTGELRSYDTPSYRPVPQQVCVGAAVADYDGDLRADRALLQVTRQTSSARIVEQWRVHESSTGRTVAYTRALPPASGEVPVAADYDGDGRAELASWSNDTGIWTISPTTSPSSMRPVQWGLPGDQPIARLDLDRDRKADFVVWRPSTGKFYVRTSSGKPVRGAVAVPGGWEVSTGLPGGTPVGADPSGCR